MPFHLLPFQSVLKNSPLKVIVENILVFLEGWINHLSSTNSTAKSKLMAQLDQLPEKQTNVSFARKPSLLEFANK